MPFETLIGGDSKGYLYFSQPELPQQKTIENKQRIYIYSNYGKLIKNILINYPKKIQYTSDFFMSPEGKVFFYHIEEGVIQFESIN